MNKRLLILIICFTVSIIAIFALLINKKAPTFDEDTSVLDLNFIPKKDGELISQIKEKRQQMVPISKLRVYSFSRFHHSLLERVGNAPSRPHVSSASTNVYYIWNFNDVFPIQSIKVINENKVLVTYRLNNDDNIVYAYVVFEKILNEVALPYELEVWLFCGEVYYISEKLSYENYKELKVGDKLSRKQMNKLAFFTESAVMRLSSYEDIKIEYEEICVLDEGLLQINVAVNDKSNYVGTVTNIEFFPFGEVSERTKNFSIIDAKELLEYPQ